MLALLRPIVLLISISLIPALRLEQVRLKLAAVISFQAQQVVRELAGVNLIGADLVEVSPLFDAAGGTAWLGVSIMFELMCALATAIAARRDG